MSGMNMEVCLIVNQAGEKVWECWPPETCRKRAREFGEKSVFTAKECDDLGIEPDFEEIGRMAFRRSDSFIVQPKNPLVSQGEVGGGKDRDPDVESGAIICRTFLKAWTVILYAGGRYLTFCGTVNHFYPLDKFRGFAPDMAWATNNTPTRVLDAVKAQLTQNEEMTWPKLYMLGG